jgi:hypothetical protein
MDLDAIGDDEQDMDADAVPSRVLESGPGNLL